MATPADGPSRRQRLGQVLIEVTLAAAGVVVIAFVMARAANWLNQSMVDRNESFQATRAAAGQSASLVPFAAPGDIHLIGPGASRGGAAGQQGASSYDHTCAAGQGFYNQATADRQQADACMRQGEIDRQQGMDLSNKAVGLVGVANVLEQYRRDINQCVQQLSDLGQQLTACQNAVQQCQTNQSTCQTDCTNCNNGCALTLLSCASSCAPGPLQAFCVAACNNTYNNTCLPNCNAQYCQTSTCTASCGDCNALQTQTQNKFVECGNLMAARDTYCGNAAAQFGVALTCDNPQSAMDAADNKMSQVNGHTWQAKNMARCVYDHIGQAEEEERRAVKECAKR